MVSDPDAQIINLSLIPVTSYPFSVFRKANSNSICKFKDSLSYENWDKVFQEGNVNILFNNFLNTVVSVADPMRNVSWMLFPGRTELVTLVKTGSRAGRTHTQ
jgi:hypothetical protein